MGTLQENIKRLRKAKGLTLEELGERIGTTRQTVCRYESGNIPGIPYDKIVKIAEVLGVRPEELMGWESSPVPDDRSVLVELYNELSPQNAAHLLTYAQFILEEQKRKEK